MVDGSKDLGQDQLIDKVIAEAEKIAGADTVYFLDNNLNIIREQKITETDNYLQEVLNIIRLEREMETVCKTFYPTRFHTYTLLNEAGLIIISKVNVPSDLYMVIIAGERQPVDLVNLLKMCKETRLGLLKSVTY